jgi:hypothetical protein
MLRDGLVVADNVLREDDPDSTCEPVRIHRSGQCVVISFNAKVSFKAKDDAICIKERLFPLFREQEGVARMCDYLIFCEQGDEPPVLYVLLCELKSGKTEGAVAQIENAKLLAEYVLEMVGHHKKLGKPEVRHRGLVFSVDFGPLRPECRARADWCNSLLFRPFPVKAFHQTPVRADTSPLPPQTIWL